MKKSIITVVGKDTVGIIARVCAYLADNNINILDISQTIVQGYFNMMMIVEISEKIGTYETSILPFEDCCTIFVAKHPVTKPNLAVIKRHEENLKDCIDEMMQRALDTEELIVVEAQ